METACAELAELKCLQSRLRLNINCLIIPSALVSVKQGNSDCVSVRRVAVPSWLLSGINEPQRHDDTT